MKLLSFFFHFFLLSITYVLPGVIFAKCFTCAATSPISSALWNLPASTTTALTEIVAIGYCSIIPFLLGTSKYPFSTSSGVKYLTTSLSNSATMFWHICSHSMPPTIATKSSPPICPTNFSSFVDSSNNDDLKPAEFDSPIIEEEEPVVSTISTSTNDENSVKENNTLKEEKVSEQIADNASESNKNEIVSSDQKNIESNDVLFDFDSLYNNLYTDVVGANNFISNLIEKKTSLNRNEKSLEEIKAKFEKEKAEFDKYVAEQKNIIEKTSKKRHENKHLYLDVNPTQLAYWLKRGYSDEESKKKISDRQKTFTLEKS